MANGAVFAEKMQSALAGLAGGGIDDEDDDGGNAAVEKEGDGRSGGGVGGQAKAVGRAERAGGRIEAEVCVFFVCFGFSSRAKPDIGIY